MKTLSQIKSQFPIFTNLPSLIYLDNAATSQKPQIVIDAISDYYSNFNANIDRGVYTLTGRSTQAYRESRKVIADFISALPSEIIFTRNTTESINLLAYTLSQNFHQDDEIIISIDAHHSLFVPFQQLSQIHGFKIKIINLDKNLHLDQKQLQSLLSNRTKLVCFSHSSNVLGTINPAEKIIKKIKTFNPNILVLLDCAQTAPHLPLSVKELNCDFLAFSAHKMCGPTGIGALYAKKEVIKSLSPFLFGGNMIKDVKLNKTTFQESPQKFEAGTPNISGAIAFAAAIKFLTQIGLDKIHHHELTLASYAYQKLSQIPLIEFINSPQNQENGIISFNIKGINCHDLAQTLSYDNICLRSGYHCAMPLFRYLKLQGSLRLSLYLYNQKSDIDSLVLSLLKSLKLFKI